MGLPSELKDAIERLLAGVSRNDLARRAAEISQTYRGGGGSDAVIAGAADAIAYVVSRLPATYAALVAVLRAITEQMPEFAPRSLLDLGAGPGTASWAAVGIWRGLHDITMIDRNAHFLRLAAQFAQHSSAPALHQAVIIDGALPQILEGTPAAELVILNYALGELPDAALAETARCLWDRAERMLVIVEPGTSAGFRRLLSVRDEVLANGGAIIAPCPHDRPCPLPANDWCHFAQRLNRSRDHRYVKSASAPFEDEKYSYFAASRAPLSARPRTRILAPPRIDKSAVGLKLCTVNGVKETAVPRHDKNGYRDARRRRWGDAVAFE